METLKVSLAAFTGALLGAGLIDATEPRPPREKFKLQKPTTTKLDAITFQETYEGPIIVGSGASGALAALSATWAGCKEVVVLEKDIDTPGGTTAKSGGIFWIPNNELMQRAGLKDPREDAVKFLCRVSFPESFDVEAEGETYGLDEIDYNRIVNFYDTGNVMLRQLVEHNVTPDLSPFTTVEGDLMYDYEFSEQDQPDNKSPIGRGLGVGNPHAVRSIIRAIGRCTNTLDPFVRKYLASVFPGLKDFNVLVSFGIDLSYGVGDVMVDRFMTALRNHNVQCRLGVGVQGLVVNELDEVVGVHVSEYEEESNCWREKYIGSRKGVVFATGGFSHNIDLVQRHLPGPIYQSSASHNSTGDFHRIAECVEADVKNMEKVWGCESILDEALCSDWETPTNILQMRGDSFFVVNAEGKRVYNEKGAYDQRVRIHWSDPEKSKFLFLVGDERCAAFNGSNFSKQWPADLNSPFYIKGDTLVGLAAAIDQRLKKLGVDFNLQQDFSQNLRNTFTRFNAFAENGKDEDFGRGDCISERQWTHSPSNDKRNVCLYPVSPTGPYYAVIIAASVLDTKGGASVNVHQQVLRRGEPIRGLYAVGNAAAPISGDSYWSGGCTLGSAMVSGYTAGLHAAVSTCKLPAHL